MKPYRDLLLVSALVLAVSCLAGVAVRGSPPTDAKPAVTPVPDAYQGPGTDAEGHVHLLSA